MGSDDFRKHVGRAGDPLEMRVADAVMVIERKRLIPTRLGRYQLDRRGGVLRALYRVLQNVFGKLLTVNGEHVHSRRETGSPRG